MDTTRSEVTVAPLDAVRRLHPFSWLFVLLINLQKVALPLIALLFLGRGEGWELFGVVGAILLALYSVVYSFGFRYQLLPTEIVVREGIFARTERHVPYERIQNVVQRRNVLHRLFGVSELILESAGGTKPEAKMSVITVAEADRIERVLRGHRHDASADEVVEDTPPPLLALDLAELVRLGLVTNRGAVAIGAAAALYWQFEPWESRMVRKTIGSVFSVLPDWADVSAQPIAVAATVLLFIAGCFVVLKVLSILMSWVGFHGFTLTRRGERVSTARGLLTHHAASARLDKIQRLVLGESWLARRLGRRWLSCDVAAGITAGSEADATRLKWLAPIATPAKIRELVDALAPGLDVDALEWRPLHPRAWQRMFRPVALIGTLIAIPLTVTFGPSVILLWAVAITFSFLDARRSAKFAGYAITPEIVAFRAGWLLRQWTIARIEKGQSINLTQSPFDRRAGMATSPSTPPALRRSASASRSRTSPKPKPAPSPPTSAPPFEQEKGVRGN